MNFVAAEYWDIVATFDPGGFTARLTSLDGRRDRAGPRLRPGRKAAAAPTPSS